MYLDLLLLHKSSLDKKIGHILPLITLQLNNLAKLFVLNNIPVAAELLLEILEDLLVTELLFKPLDGSQALLSIPLLYTYVHILFRPRRLYIVSLSKWIESR